MDNSGTAFRENKKIKQIRIGDITIDAVIEREGPWRRPRDFFPVYDEAVFRHHLPKMEPEVFDEAQGMIVMKNDRISATCR